MREQFAHPVRKLFTHSAGQGRRAAAIRGRMTSPSNGTSNPVPTETSTRPAPATRDGRAPLDNLTVHLARLDGNRIVEIWFHNFDGPAVAAFWA